MSRQYQSKIKPQIGQIIAVGHGVLKVSCISDSAEASELDKVKQTTAEQQAKSEQRRMKFQAQDSVLAESLTYDWAEAEKKWMHENGGILMSQKYTQKRG